MLSTFVAVHAISLSLSLKVLTKQRLAFAALHNMPVDALVALAAGLGGGSSKQPAYDSAGDSHYLPAEAAAVTEVLVSTEEFCRGARTVTVVLLRCSFILCSFGDSDSNEGGPGPTPPDRRCLAGTPPLSSSSCNF